MILYEDKFQAIPYSTMVSIVLCDNINDARRSLGLKLYDKSNWDRNCVGRYYIYTGKNREKFHIFMFINVMKHEGVSDLIDTVDHEVVHITNQILNNSGVDSDYNNDEAQAYLLGYISGRVWKFLLEKQTTEFSPSKEYLQIVTKDSDKKL